MAEANVTFRARVWFSCHPEDYGKWFHTITLDLDLLCNHPCDFYSSYSSTWETEDDQKLAFSSMQLVVVPITYNLLTSEECTAYSEIAAAQKMGIPVLPIIVEPNLDLLYNKKFGKLQYLDRVTIDETAIPYGVKLSNLLRRIFPSDVTIQKILKCFDAHVFLSYRKKDRCFANKLMQVIHRSPKLRDVAIFFDELLTPGESFETEIAEQIVESDAVVMVVTPNVLKNVVDSQGNEAENYIVSKEYPLAVKHGKRIIPVEFLATDRKGLVSKYPETESCVVINEKDSVSPDLERALLACLAHKKLRKTVTPEQDYLVGLAFLHGICVEVDRSRGIQLITDAAIAGFSDAKDYLESIYWADDDIHNNILLGVLAAEKELHSLQDKPDRLIKKFILLYQIGEAYLALCNPREKPAYTITIAAERAANYLSAAIQLANQIEISGKTAHILARAYMAYAGVADGNNQKIQARQKSVEIAKKLVQQKNSKKNLNFLAEMLACSLAHIEYTDNDSLDVGDRHIENETYYAEILLQYKEAMATLVRRDNSHQNNWRYCDVLCLCAEHHIRKHNKAEAIACYLECIDLGRKTRKSEIIRRGAMNLLKIYADENNTEMVQKYMGIYMNPVHN